MQKHMKGHKPEDVPADWRIEKTYLYVCYVWAGLGPHAKSDTRALSLLGENLVTPVLLIFHAESMGLKKIHTLFGKTEKKLSFWEIQGFLPDNRDMQAWIQICVHTTLGLLLMISFTIFTTKVMTNIRI